MATCKGVTRHGKACSAPANRSGFCPNHDPRRAKVRSEHARRIRLGAVARETPLAALSSIPPQPASEAERALAETLSRPPLTFRDTIDRSAAIQAALARGDITPETARALTEAAKLQVQALRHKEQDDGDEEVPVVKELRARGAKLTVIDGELMPEPLPEEEALG